MKEKVYTFGPREALVGVVTQPDPAKRRQGAPALVLLNAGLVPRVGPYRLYVEMARRFAAQGWLVLRFDQSGLGDSEPRRDDLGYDARAVADIREAIELLAGKLGAESFVSMGICTGAMNAHRAGLADPRVTGAVLIDGYTYRTPGYELRYYAPRIFSPSMLASTVRRRADDVARRLGTGRHVAPAAQRADSGGAAAVRAPEDLLAEADDIFQAQWPDRPTIARELRDLTGRGVKMLFVYTGGGAAGDTFNHARQFGEMFPDRAVLDRVEVEFLPRADHTFTLRCDRDALVGRIERWLHAHHGGS